MTGKKMIELLQQHHPHIGETEALMLINQAKDDFSEDTEMYNTIISAFDTVSGQLYYDVGLAADTSIFKILNVWGGDSGQEILMPRLQGTLKIKDSV